MKRLIYFAVGAIFLTANSIAAQTAEKEEKIELCHAEIANSLVVQQISESKTVEATDKQIKILLRAASFLWKYDEPAARKHFADALELARLRFKEKGVEVKKGGKSFYTEIADLRFTVLSAIAKHDAVWADKLTAQVLKEFESEVKTDNPFGASQPERLLEIAASLLPEQKASAAIFARRAMPLKTGRNFGRWHAFLYQMARVDQNLADQLYAEAVAAQAAAPINDVLYFSGYPFGNERIYGYMRGSISIGSQKNFVPNPLLQHRFIELLIEKTNALEPQTEVKTKNEIPEAAAAFSAFQDLELLAAASFPDLMPRFAAAKAHANSLMTAENAAKLSEQQKNSERWTASFEDKLKQLETAKPEDLDSDIVSLITIADSEDELQKAEKWLAKISEAKVLEAATNYFYFKRAEIAVRENRIPEAEKFAAKVPEIEHRAVIYFKIAEAKLKTENDKLRAAEVLENVVKIALQADNGIERAQVLLGTAFYFDKYNHFRAAEVLTEAVKTINRLENPDLSQTAIFRAIEGKNFGHYIGYSMPGYNLEKSFESVARQDFQGAIAQAQNLTDKYLKTLAVIAAVSDCAKNKVKSVKKAKK